MKRGNVKEGRKKEERKLRNKRGESRGCERTLRDMEVRILKKRREREVEKKE